MGKANESPIFDFDLGQWKGHGSPVPRELGKESKSKIKIRIKREKRTNNKRKEQLVS